MRCLLLAALLLPAIPALALTDAELLQALEPVVTELKARAVPPPPPPPAPLVESVDGATIPPSGQIVDADLAVWTLEGGEVLRNAVKAGFTSNVAKVSYRGGSVYQVLADGREWKWENDAWVDVIVTPPPPPVPVAMSVKDHGATGNGTTNDTTSIKNAFAAAFKTPSKAVRFPAGTYYLGAHSSGDVIFNLSSFGDGLTLVSEGAKFVLNTTTVTQPRIFYVTGQKNIAFLGSWYFEDLGGNNFYPKLVQYKGATAITVGANSSYISIDKLHVLNLQGGFIALPESAQGSTHHITINEIHGKGTMYVFNLQHQGNQVKVGIINAENCGRPFFVFGVDGVEATVIAKNNADGYHSFIAQYGGPNTRNVKLKLSDTRPYGKRQQVLTIAHLNKLGAASIIENIDVEISLNFTDTPWANSYQYGIVRLSSYASSYEEISSSNHTWRNIKISGVKGSNPYLVWSGFNSLIPKGSISLPAGEPLPSGFANLFNVTTFAR